LGYGAFAIGIGLSHVGDGIIATNPGKYFHSSGAGIDAILWSSIRNIGGLFLRIQSSLFEMVYEIRCAAIWDWGLLELIQASSTIQQDREMTLF
jgi:hypothetical protein